MVSSRTSSPAAGSEPASPSQLTPRSKVKAMLAALDDDSDTASTLTMKGHPSLQNSATRHTAESALNHEKHAPSRSSMPTTDEDNEDDEEDVIRPRGRLVGRMMKGQVEISAGLEKDAETARDRVRRMLLTKKHKSPESASVHRSDSENAEFSPIISRKRKLRTNSHSLSRSSPFSDKQISSAGGMFVSPGSNKSLSPAREAQQSDEDLPANPNANTRFLALVDKARRERQAKEAEVARRKAEQVSRHAKVAAYHDTLLEDDKIEPSDDDIEKQLTQQVRPTRKASRKALEDMHKETQRMSRNMQLAHEARTKKKITKSSLFAKFNYKPAGFIADESVSETRPVSSSSPGHSGVDMSDTPPSSPPSHTDPLIKPTETTTAMTVEDPLTILSHEVEEQDIPDLGEALSQRSLKLRSATPSRLEKGKGKAIEQPPNSTEAIRTASNKTIYPQTAIRVQLQKEPSKITMMDESDSDLEIEAERAPPCKIRKDSIFDRVPAKQARESHSLHVLRMLAQQTSPRKQVIKRNAKPSMTTGEMHASLQQRARQQALREREERLQNLRDRGIIVQTAEEKEQEMADVENLMEKARREAEALMKREKLAAKANKTEGDINDPLGDSDDDEWEEEIDAFSEQISASGSDDGDDEHEMSSDGEGNETDNEKLDETDASKVMKSADDRVISSRSAAKLIDDEASENGSDEELLPVQSRRRTKNIIVSDDDDDDNAISQSSSLSHTNSPMARNSASPTAPQSVLRSATKTFIPGLTVAGPAGLGLTQIFAGTMDDSQGSEEPDQILDHTGSPLQQMDESQDSMAFLRNFPAPALPVFEPTMEDDSQEIVRDSQTQISKIPASQIDEIESQGIQLNFSQSQIHCFDSLVGDVSATQISEYPEPTQDAGFQDMTPIKGRFAELPVSTIETVLLGQTPVTANVETFITETPIVKKKGRLQRRHVIAELSDDEGSNVKAQADDTDGDFEISSSAFDVMRKASKKSKEIILDDFDKKKSGAKAMVHEQAEESEDEYAGLGGNSDDESGGEEDAFVKEMIDDDASQNVDERQLAAFYADKERANDEKEVEKLFKDITNGTLRRKRGANYDLSDSDDDGEARRRMKQKEFAKMRKALLEDERIGKIAENPKRLAFLRAIEDRGDEDEVDFLDDFPGSQEPADSQSQSQSEVPQQEVSQGNDGQSNGVMGPPKRKLSADVVGENRLPPNLRRTKVTKKPSNLSEIRQSLSSLIEEPNALHVTPDSSDSELEIEESEEGSEQKVREKENRDPFASRRSKNIAVVDRISLKRASSSSLSTTARLAFAASSSGVGFKVPALLRRATTNSSISSTSSISATERMAGGLGDNSKTIAKKAGKNSGVNYFARENERRVAIKEVEKRREEKRFKGAEGRRKAVGGLFGMGKFE